MKVRPGAAAALILLGVCAALVFVAREEAPLGIVYATDAISDARVKVVAAFPESSHPPIVYPIALTAAGDSEAPALFLDFLKGAAGKAVFQRLGFIPLPPPSLS